MQAQVVRFREEPEVTFVHKYLCLVDVGEGCIDCDGEEVLRLGQAEPGGQHCQASEMLKFCLVKLTNKNVYIRSLIGELWLLVYC